MSDDTTAKQDGTADANIAAIRHRRQRRRPRLIMLALAAIVISATIAWHFLLPSSTGGMPSGLSGHDKKEIASLLRGWTVRRAFQMLRMGEFRECIRSVKISRKQRINRFIDDHNGTFRVYTVVDSPKDTDGWYAWSRHVMIKTNDQWVILRSY